MFGIHRHHLPSPWVLRPVSFPFEFLNRSILVVRYYCGSMVSLIAYTDCLYLFISWVAFSAWEYGEVSPCSERTLCHLTNFTPITVSSKNMIMVSIIVSRYAELNVELLTAPSLQSISSLGQLSTSCSIPSKYLLTIFRCGNRYDLEFWQCSPLKRLPLNYQHSQVTCECCLISSHSTLLIRCVAFPSRTLPWLWTTSESWWGHCTSTGANYSNSPL
jgi:hypothetical protein